MPKPSNLYQRNGIFYARIQVGGTERRVSLKTANRTEAKERLRKLLKENSPYHGTISKTFDMVMAEFLEEARSRLKPKTVARYDTSALQLANKWGGQLWPQVTKQSVVEYIDERKRQGVKIPTIKRDLTVLSQAAEYAMEREYGGANPVKEISSRQMRHKKWKFVRPDPWSVETTIALAYGNMRKMAMFMRATGLRRDEAVGLKWPQIDQRRRTATLYETKSGQRTVSLNDAAMAVLATMDRKSAVVFPSASGDAYKQATGSWRESRARAQKAAQLEKRPYTPIRIHDLRHIYAIEYLENGGNLYVLQKQLGHSTIRQTEEYLDYLSPEEAERAKSGPAHRPAQPTPVSTGRNASKVSE
jgi:integrase/recombinase XerD